MEPSHHFLDAVLASCRWSPSIRNVFDRLNRSTDRRVLIACSGGADSVFLLHTLLAYAVSKPTHIVVAHYNHAWRPASDGDADFVASLAQHWNLPFVVKKNTESSQLKFSETAARELRMKFLRKMAQVHRCKWIAFGHQMNDVLETQLQRLARGSGVAGLAAPRPVHAFESHTDHLRPLMGLKSQEIRSMLQAAGICWREDSSNLDDSIQRNGLRNQIVPKMQALMDRDLLLGAAKSRERMQEDAEALDCWAAKVYADIESNRWCLNVLGLRSLPVAIIRRCLFLWLRKHFDLKKLRLTVMQPLIDAIVYQEKEYTRSIGQYFLLIEGDYLRLVNPESYDGKLAVDYAISLSVGDKRSLPQGATITAELVNLDPATLKRILNGQVDCNCEVYVQVSSLEDLMVRTWQPGDRYTPLGCSGSKKLKACFRERGFSKMERLMVPIVTVSNAIIVWVPGMPPANAYKLDPESKTALRLTYLASQTN